MSFYVYRCPLCPAVVALAASLTGVPRCHTHGPNGLPLGGHPATMELVLDQLVLLPIDMAPGRPDSIVPAKVAALHEAGLLTPETQHALDWLWRHRATNGMAGAFLKVGGRRCIDLVAFARLMREKRA